MALGSPFSRFAVALVLALQLSVVLPSRAGIVVNEVVAGASDRLLQWDSSGVPRVGAGNTSWQGVAFDDSKWKTGPGPFGFGSFTGTQPTIGTSVSTAMLNLTPTLYLRRTFSVSAADAASTVQVQFSATYNDGFVAYLNGVEIARRWAGPVNGFIYHDQPAYNISATNTTNPTTQYTYSVSVGVARDLLKEGNNVLAIQGLNWSSASSNFLIQPILFLNGGNILVAAADTFRYFPGTVEPSGTFYDPTLLNSGRLNVDWGTVAYDDSTWSTGAGPLRVGTGSGGTVVSGVVGVTPTLYTRAVFNATAAQVADTAQMRLTMDYNDGFVAYINGVEVARANVGGVNAFTPYTAVATTTRSAGTGVAYVIDTPTSILKQGSNVLAIQVHNVSINDATLYLKPDLRNNAGTTFVANTGTFRYLPGTVEPVAANVGTPSETPDGPDSDSDWVELYNDGPTAVSLAGWTLTDTTKTPAKWTFPAGASISAGGYLVVFCDGLDITAPAAGGYYHTNFSISAGGEYLGLYDASGKVVQNFLPILPPSLPFYSYGRDASGSYVYLDNPTPGAANSSSTYAAVAADPVFNLAGGFYTGSQSVSLTTTTPNATILYTADGSEPSATNGTTYSGVISLTSSVAIRARTLAPNMVPSRVVTNSYLLNQSATIRSLPALAITGDPMRTLYRPFGILAIVNNATGNYSNGTWTANGDASLYNNLSVDGRALERPASMELLYAPGAAPTGYGNVKTDFGLRSSGSNYTFPRYVLSTQNSIVPNAGVWSTNFTEKPSFNLFFRSELGGDPLVAPMFPSSPVTSFHGLRLRAGHNDGNPFVLDELQRRTFLEMGQVGSGGILNTLFVNGVYKGYFNLCEHVREPFLQQAYKSSNTWDVRQVAEVASGDGIAFQEMITFLRNNPQGTLANYQAMSTRLDMVNFADYLLVNVYGADQDWPENNYIVSRERSNTGIHRFHVWDAEFSYGLTQGNGVYANSFISGSNSGTGGYITVPLVTSTPSSDSLTRSIRILYTLLKASPEFRLLFADRVQRNMFNDGAMTNARVLARWTELSNQIKPFIGSYNDAVTGWVNGSGSIPSRRQVLLGYTNTSGTAVVGHLTNEGLWPATAAPTVNQFGGTVTPGFQVTLSNPNSSGTIYYTTDGNDPRVAGGTVRGVAYSSPITVNQTTIVKARVLSSSGEWSPLLAPTFVVSALPSLQITELMYHPPLTGSNTTENEFIEIKNTGTTTVSLGGMSFTSGITYAFASGATLAAGRLAVLVKDQAQFSARYPAVTIAGVYTGSLSNSGDTITLSDVTGAAIYSVTYSATSPWPTLPNGYGQSLVPVNPNVNANPNDPTNWRASAFIGGSPSADDPTPTTPTVFVNEVLANSGAGLKDAVELYNPTANAADISGWFLTDSDAALKKFQIPAGTVIPAGEYLVFTESDFNETTPTGANVPFAFDSNGEQVRLSAADASGNLTGYSDGFTFGASSENVSFGRYVNSVGVVSYPAQKSMTLGAANAGPLVGPLVITELMYAPVSTGDEFAEIRNISNQPVQLFDPANPANAWKLDGIGFTFPAGVVIAPGEIMLIVPLTESAWRTKYPAMPAAVRVFGAYTGKQDNSGEKLSLQKPGVPYLNAAGATRIPYIDVDYVDYRPTSPWPTTALTTGPSIERKLLTGFGDDAGNWRASPTNGGSPGALATFNYTSWNSLYFTPAQIGNLAISGPNADPDGDGISNLLEYAFGFDPLGSNGLPYSASITTSGGSQYATLTYRRSTATSGLAFFGDTSGSLASTWTLGNAVQVGTATNNGDGTETVVLRDTVPTTSASQRFIRLRVTSN